LILKAWDKSMNFAEEKPLKSLIKIRPRKSAKIIRIAGGKNARLILGQLGIGVGSEVKVLRNAPFAGPILLENSGTSVAIGRGIAAKIIVEEI